MENEPARIEDPPTSSKWFGEDGEEIGDVLIPEVENILEKIQMRIVPTERPKWQITER